MERRRRGSKQRLPALRAACRNGSARRSAIALAKQIEEHDGGRDLLRQQLHARGRRMKAQLQRFEIEPAAPGDHDFAVQHATLGQLRAQRIEQFGEVAVERLLVAALDQDLVAVAKNQRAKSIPFRFEDPAVAFREFADALGEHGQNRADLREAARSHATIHPGDAQRLASIRAGNRQGDHPCGRSGMPACRVFQVG